MTPMLMDLNTFVTASQHTVNFFMVSINCYPNALAFTTVAVAKTSQFLCTNPIIFQGHIT